MPAHDIWTLIAIIRLEVQITWFGFVTIPLLSVATFSVIIGLTALAHVKSSK